MQVGVMFFFRLLASTALSCYIQSYAQDDASPGALRLVRNGQPTDDSGILQAYITGIEGTDPSWGNICDNFAGAAGGTFRQNEADVTCHQLGYTGALSFTNVGINNTFGVDNSSSVAHSVRCDTSQYLTLSQCEFNVQDIPAECDDNSRDIIVVCNPMTIFFPTYGNIRLVGGATTNVGILQVYCDSDWGTVCEGEFSEIHGALACKQLGYNVLIDMSTAGVNGNKFEIEPIPSGPIWLQSFPFSCSPDTNDCLIKCAECPVEPIDTAQCTHANDIIIDCGYTFNGRSVGTGIDTVNTCSQLDPFINDAGRTSSIITASSTSSFGTKRLMATYTPIVAPPNSAEAVISGTVVGAIVGGVVTFFIILAVGVAVLVFVIIRRKRRATADATTDNTVMDLVHDNNDIMETDQNEYILMNKTDAKLSELLLPCLIDKVNLKLIEKVGQGEFGVVYRGLLTVYENHEPEVQSVAVKTLKGKYSQTQTDELIVEAEKMIQFNHLNVLSLTGICVGLVESPCLVMPYMSNGSLLSYLRKESADLVVSESADENLLMDTVKHLLSMCLQVANGMAYLAEHKFIHRDLAARNCMISADAIIKVADFGLAEDIYTAEYFKQERSSDDSVKLPLKWMALESIHYGKFCEKTDVWSYGILCWEVFSAGKSPYPGMSPREVVEILDSGERLLKPLNPACTDEIYEFMLSCWDKSPEKRPHFSDIVISTEKILAPLADYVEFSDAFTKKLSHGEL